jgi:small subunit ribosomal protein S17
MADEKQNEQDETQETAEVVEEATEAAGEGAVDESAAEALPVEEEVTAEVTPASTDEPEAEGDGEETAAPSTDAAAPVGKRKRKRLPRTQRPQKTRRQRAPSTTRKPIVRLEKPVVERGRRQERQGTVVSDAMDKSIVVEVDLIKAHPKYKKVVRRSTRFHAHDERNEAKRGDVVRIVETRPLSKTKRWRLTEVVEAAK